MKLFGYLIDSILTPETRFVVTTRRFIDTLGDEYPAFISLNRDDKIIRELVLIHQSRFNGRKVQEGYKYIVESKSDGRLSSLSDCQRIILGIRAKKLQGLNLITTQLRFFGIRGDKLHKILILHDVPILAKNRKDLLIQIRDFLGSWNIKIANIPEVIWNINREKSLAKSKLIDVDYLKFPL